MDLKEVCAELGEGETRVQYWRNTLKKFGLIDPKKGAGNKDVYSENDVEMFRKVRDYLQEGVPTATDVCRLIAGNLTPDKMPELKRQLETANRQIQLLQNKLLDLRKPFWKRVWAWVKGLVPRSLFRGTEQ